MSITTLPVARKFFVAGAVSAADAEKEMASSAATDAATAHSLATKGSP